MICATLLYYLCRADLICEKKSCHTPSNPRVSQFVQISHLVNLWCRIFAGFLPSWKSHIPSFGKSDRNMVTLMFWFALWGMYLSLAHKEHRHLLQGSGFTSENQKHTSLSDLVWLSLRVLNKINLLSELGK